MVAGKKSSAAKAPRRKPESVEDYLASVPPDARAALLKLRKTIQAAAPRATEEISYQVPTFKQNGGLVAYAAFPDHCSFFVMSTGVMRAHAAELAGYPVHDAVVSSSVEEARLTELEAQDNIFPDVDYRLYAT